MLVVGLVLGTWRALLWIFLGDWINPCGIVVAEEAYNQSFQSTGGWRALSSWYSISLRTVRVTGSCGPGDSRVDFKLAVSVGAGSGLTNRLLHGIL